MFLCFTVIREQKARWRADHLTRLGPQPFFLSGRASFSMVTLLRREDRIRYHRGWTNFRKTKGIETRVVRHFLSFSRRNDIKSILRDSFREIYFHRLGSGRFPGKIYNFAPRSRSLRNEGSDFQANNIIFPLSASLAARRIDERSSRLLDGRKSEGMTTARMKKGRRKK